MASVSPDFQTLARELFADHRALLEATQRDCLADLGELAECSCNALQAGGKLLLFGNGGSAADAQHLATELTVRYLSDRRALAAIALTTDSSTLTAAANDVGFEQIFSRQIEALGQPGDVAIGISTSGQSPNVLRALDTAVAMGLTVAGFCGANADQMRARANLVVQVPSVDTPRVQEMHILLGHLLCHQIERRLS